MPGPWEKYAAPGAAPVAPAPGPVYGPPPVVDPYKAEDQQMQRDAAARSAAQFDVSQANQQVDQANAATRLQMEQERLRLAREAAARETVTAQQGTESERTAGFLAKRLVDATKAMASVGQTDRAALSPTFGVEAVRKIAGDTAANYITDADRQQVRAHQIDILDAALTLGTGAAYTREQIEGYREAYFPKLGDDPATITAKSAKLRSLLESAKVKAGRAAPDIDSAIAALDALGGVEREDDPAALPANPLSTPGGETPLAPTDGPSGISPKDAAFAKAAHALYKRGASLEQLVEFMQKSGRNPDEAKMQELRDAIQFRDEGKGFYQFVPPERERSDGEQVLGALGNSPLGAYAAGAGQFLSGNSLDNIGGEGMRFSLQDLQSRFPTANALGEVSGGVMGAVAGEAGLARLGMAPGFLRGVTADAAFGGFNGAGAADNGNRALGALGGAALSATGSSVGQGITRGASRVIAPTGGSMDQLYAAGVRPTLGQRVADKGVIGRAVNATEEAMQSLPLVGSAISGARQEARDQFQVGAFNEALKEIGEKLPAGTKPGTDPHAYAQASFNRVYAQARSGMKMVADQQLGNDIGALAQDIAALGPQARGKLKAILANTVNNRLRNGQMAGNDYKKAISDLGKRIAQQRKGSMADDQALADVLMGVQDALEAAARRHSHPDAVALLDAADAGYAKLVRIEDAAMRRGGDDGTFTPTQFDAAVQRTSGGVRSRAYLRGDALMQDYANQGKGLVDRLSNSGTTDRALAATTVAGGSAYLIDPSILGVLGVIGTAYAPGVRKLTKGAIAPAGSGAIGTGRKAIAAQLRKRARLVGAASGASAVSGALGTSPGP